jgi:hypothetical protein
LAPQKAETFLYACLIEFILRRVAFHRLLIFCGTLRILSAKVPFVKWEMFFCYGTNTLHLSGSPLTPPPPHPSTNPRSSLSNPIILFGLADTTRSLPITSNSKSFFIFFTPYDVGCRRGSFTIVPMKTKNMIAQLKLSLPNLRACRSLARPRLGTSRIAFWFRTCARSARLRSGRFDAQCPEHSRPAPRFRVPESRIHLQAFAFDQTRPNSSKFDFIFNHLIKMP